MKRLKSLALISLMLLLGPTAAQGQSELDRLFEKIKTVVEDAEPGWRCTRGEPFGAPTTSPNLLIMGCALEAQARLTRRATHTVEIRHVAISVAPLQSAEEARRFLHNFVNERPNEVREIRDLKDEAYGWGMDNANIVLINSRFKVFISTVAHVEFDADAKALTLDQKNERKKSERLKLTHDFAKHALAALDSF